MQKRVAFFTILILFGILSGCQGNTADNNIINEEIQDDNSTGVVLPESIIIQDDLINLEVGETLELFPDVRPDNAADKSLTYDSSDLDVVMVTNGLIRGISPGSANITLSTSNDITVSINVVVIEPEILPTSISLGEKNIELTIGQNTFISAEVLPNNASNKSLFYESSNPNIATVLNDGFITAVGIGETEITVMTHNNITTTVKITVTEPKPQPNVITDRSVVRYEDEGLYRFFIGFEDKDDNRVKTSGQVDIKIYDDSEKLIYEKLHSFNETDFSSWGNDFSGYSLKLAIEIPINDIDYANSSNGKLVYKIDLDSGAYWNTLNIDIDQLPVDFNLVLPSTPFEIKRYFSTGTLWYTLRITDITWDYSTGNDNKIDLSIYFSGTKTYYYEGNNTSSSNSFSTRIKDSEGFVIDSNSVFPPSLMVGDSFRDERVRIWDLEIGETYELEVIKIQR